MSEATIIVHAAHLAEADRLIDAIAAHADDEPEFVEVFAQNGDHLGMWISESGLAESERPTDPTKQYVADGHAWYFQDRQPTQREIDLGTTIRLLLRKLSAGKPLLVDQEERIRDMLKRFGVQGSVLR